MLLTAVLIPALQEVVLMSVQNLVEQHASLTLIARIIVWTIQGISMETVALPAHAASEARRIAIIMTDGIIQQTLSG
jgi:hypothetical protein